MSLWIFFLIFSQVPFLQKSTLMIKFLKQLLILCMCWLILKYNCQHNYWITLFIKDSNKWFTILNVIKFRLKRLCSNFFLTKSADTLHSYHYHDTSWFLLSGNFQQIISSTCLSTHFFFGTAMQSCSQTFTNTSTPEQWHK